MADALHGAGEREEADRQRLADEEREAASRDLAKTTVAAAQAAVAKVQRKDGGSLLGEPARDLMAIRTDPRFAQALRADLGHVQGRMEESLQRALWAGFVIACQTRSEGLPVTADPDESDRASLVGMPIGGLSAAELAAEIADALERAVLRSMAAPISGTEGPVDVGTLIAQAVNAHAERCASAVIQAHLTGVSACVRSIGSALVGAP